MNILNFSLSLMLVFFSLSYAKEKTLILQEDEYCNFKDIMLDEESEAYPHIISIVSRKNGDKITVIPIHNKKYEKIVIKLNDNNINIKPDEEIEFFILDDNKACISKRGLR